MVVTGFGGSIHVDAHGGKFSVDHLGSDCALPDEFVEFFLIWIEFCG